MCIFETRSHYLKRKKPNPTLKRGRENVRKVRSDKKPQSLL